MFLHEPEKDTSTVVCDICGEGQASLFHVYARLEVVPWELRCEGWAGKPIVNADGEEISYAICPTCAASARPVDLHRRYQQVNQRLSKALYSHDALRGDDLRGDDLLAIEMSLHPVCTDKHHVPAEQGEV